MSLIRAKTRALGQRLLVSVKKSRFCYSRLHFGFKRGVPYETFLSENASGAAMRMTNE